MNVLPGTPQSLLDALLAPSAAAVLLAGAPGMGKSSVLSSAAQKAKNSLRWETIWIDGGVVASEGHLAALLASAISTSQQVASLEAVIEEMTSSDREATLLVIDNLDWLVFKRERVTRALAVFLESDSGRVLASCHPAAADRLAGGKGPFAAVTGRTSTFTLMPLADDEAEDLVLRRAPRLPAGIAKTVIAAAGGHPAALVFLSRMAEVGVGSELETEDFFERAAEFAGAVYAESWAQIGPQQRAILYQISRAGGSASMAEIAQALTLPPSHVGAQISRLVMDGLVLRPAIRGRYEIPLLLARWIERRAARAPRGKEG
jgi:DNA-binding transcriptional ArsR family regulator